MEGCRWWDRCVGGPRFGSLLYLSLLLEYERGVAGSQAAWSGEKCRWSAGVWDRTAGRAAATSEGAFKCVHIIVAILDEEPCTNRWRVLRT